MAAIDLSKQQVLDADPKAIQQINFITNLDREGNSQLNKFKSAMKDENEVVLRLSSNMIGDTETNFPHKLLLTNRQVSMEIKWIFNTASSFN